MDTTTTVVVIVVILVLLAALAAWWASRRSKARRRHEAAEVRAHAAAHHEGIRSSSEDLAVAQSRADIARAEAERAEREAMEARRELDMERALQEDRVREADALDPDVDHRAGDYEPTLDRVETPETTTDGETYEREPGRHRTT